MYRKPKACGGPKGFLRACLCVICSLALALTLTPAFALENTNGSSGVSSDDPTASPEQQVQSVDLQDKDATCSSQEGEPGIPINISGISHFDLNGPQASESLSLFATDNDASTRVALKPTNETRWIDRVAFPEEFKSMAEDFYNLLAEACDNDGEADYFIDDKYIRYESAPSTDSLGIFYKFDAQDEKGTTHKITSLEIGSFKYDNTATLSEKEAILKECALAVLAAFDRDHPEVFWLDGSVSFAYGDLVSGLHSGFLILSSYSILQPLNVSTIRNASFYSQEYIKKAIDIREQRVKELMNKVSATYNPNRYNVDKNGNTVVLPSSGSNKYSNASIVRYFNKWLTFSNGYNSMNLDTLSTYCPLAFECLSALVGRSGRPGPVCEGYARAFKVLCDSANIPCVLVDGSTNNPSENHMWNYVMIDGKWYAVDATWNDPGTADILVSGKENERYLLVGSSTMYNTTSGLLSFIQCHNVQNKHFRNGLCFTNGPVLQTEAYDLSKLPNVLNTYTASEFSKLDISFADIDIGMCSISGISDMAYTGSAIKPNPGLVKMGSITLVNGIHYSLSYSNNVNVGTAYMTITAYGRFVGTKTYSYSIRPVSVRVSSVSVGDTVYNGVPQYPTPAVKLANPGITLGKDYTIDYSYFNNVNAGVGDVTVTIRGKGNYTGTISRNLKFVIYPPRASLKKLTAKKKSFVVKWNKAKSSWASGYQLMYSMKSSFSSGVKTITVPKVSTSQKTIKKLKKKKKYYVAIRVYVNSNGATYYGDWSVAKKVKTK